MKPSTYGDEQIDRNEMAIIIASVVIGVGILTFPRTLAKETESVDGWISIIIGGVVSCVVGWFLAKLAARFPKRTFMEFASLLVPKPVAALLMVLILFSRVCRV